MDDRNDIETSAAVPGAGAVERTKSDVDDQDVDEETVLAAIKAARKHEIGVTVGAIAPPLLGVLLLRLAGGGMWAVPWQALVAIMAVCVASVPVILGSSRRAFLAECASLGIAKPQAKKLYRAFWRAQLRIEKSTPGDVRDRALASRLVRPKSLGTG